MSMTDEKWFVTLGWALLEFRCMYFAPDRVHSTWKGSLTIGDADFDHLEAEYLDLAIKLDQEPTATAGIGFDVTRPAERMVAQKLGHPKGGNRGLIEAGDIGRRPRRPDIRR